jgi:sugar phosphate permease
MPSDRPRTRARIDGTNKNRPAAFSPVPAVDSCNGPQISPYTEKYTSERCRRIIVSIALVSSSPNRGSLLMVDMSDDEGATDSSLGSVGRLPASSIHYAWIVAGVTFAILLTAGGIRGSSGIFMVPLETEFQWSRATVSFAVGANLCMYGLVGPFAAAAMEAFGVRRTVIAALGALGVGLLAAPFMQQAWQFVLLWGVLVGAGTGITANVLAVTVATRWFAAKRGLVTGMLTSAAAAGQLLFLPALAELTASHGWRWMSLTLAVAALVLIPLVAALIRDRPQDIGLVRYGEERRRDDIPVRVSPSNLLRGPFETLSECSRSRDFWLIGSSIFICGASTQGLIGTHLIPACIDHGIPEVAAAGLLGGMAIFNAVGATASGWLSDRLDARLLLATFYGLRGLSLIYLPYGFDSFYGLSVFSVFYGLDWIATIPATMRLITDRFSAQRAGMVFGWVMVLHQIGGAAAAYLAGYLRMDLGTYLQAFMLSGALCFIAAFIPLFMRGESGKDPQVALAR